MKIKFWLYRNYWLALPLIAVGIILLAFFQVAIDFKVTSAALGALLSLVYFVQKQRLEEMKLFREIFQECNNRYDHSNEKINAIIRSDISNELSKDDENTLDDYFNLCGEEYLYYKQGYIYPDVWETWENGMKSVLTDSRVKEYWLKEKKSDSYYGLPL